MYFLMVCFFPVVMGIAFMIFMHFAKVEEPKPKGDISTES
jgi:hypothetical protein